MTFCSFQGFTSPTLEVECNDKFVGLNNEYQLQKGCGWKGLVKDTIRKDYCSDELSWKHLSGKMGIQYLCPHCHEILIDEIGLIS